MSLRVLRTRIAPWGLWCATMASVAWLWGDVHDEAAVGFVLAAEYELATPEPARVAAVAVAPGQRVRAGDVLVSLDARAIDAELAIVAAERARLEAELGAVRAESKVRVGDTTREFDESVAAADVALRTARAERKVAAAEYAALSEQVATLGGLVEQRMADRRELDALRVEHVALEKQLQTADALIPQLVSQAAAARARRAALPADATEAALRPVQAELAVIERQEQLLAVRREAMTLRAAVDGDVAAVHLQAGEVADTGLPIVTLVGDATAAEVQVCQREAQASRGRAGEAVRVRPRGSDGAEAAGRVVRVAPRIAELPPRCWRDPKLPEWGRELVVRLDEPLPLLPGQAVAVRFLGEDAGSAAATTLSQREVSAAATTLSPREMTGEASPGAAPRVVSTSPNPSLEAPSPLVVPPALAARTRFEPSALTWSARRDRFVIASDDTGLADRDEHAPWLFTMDRHGRLDASPLVVSGIDGFSDLEAIAPAPEDGLYVLASQSRSRKGKRPAARQVFARIAVTAGGATLEASVSLAEQLERDPALLAALGLADTAELDLEGMTATAGGGLLLGLKQPLDAEQRAPIWHLPHPDALLAGATPSAAGLRRLGAVALRVETNGGPVPGGISELLELPDGSLLIAATASGADPQRQDGGLWHAAGIDDLAHARLLRRFPGLKPEGLALRPDGQAIVLVFDTGAAAPEWMELQWPAP
ncbi:HlyD family efflux transporter periplasmic adaptor subunit [Nannocystis sp. RBIL2]|uniref:HlyD family efflux transporter periplasmic adaptor subunit n=1 Tax=Nannocystis sp. RBIL2 TaxID=2996788 RepID=UPI00226FC191|nr:HlyD family efflux transporter periplasmic adaptor subunit [Nannocystis sp. RBIL2]MCY1070210.1 HlyD family efflux transporter periplasmic adaptor subunit [Nannocystis sp. RBIL2]